MGVVPWDVSVRRGRSAEIPSVIIAMFRICDKIASRDLGVEPASRGAPTDSGGQSEDAQ